MADNRPKSVARGFAATVGRVLHGPPAALALVVLLGMSQPAHAYLDAGTGSILLQMLLGGVAGAVVIGKLYWYRIKTLIGRGDDQQKPTPEQANQQHPAE